MIWIMLAPQLMEENGRPPLEISPPLIYQMLAPRPPFLPLAPPKIRGGAFYALWHQGHDFQNDEPLGMTPQS